MLASVAHIKNSTFRKRRSWHPVPLLHGKWMGKQWKQWQTLFWGAPKSLQTVTVATKLRRSLLGRKAMTDLYSLLKSRDITLPTKVHLIKAMVFPVVIYGCWTIKKAERQRIDAFELWGWEKTLESPLDSKEIQPVHPKGNKPWIFIGRTEAEAETPTLWPPNVKNQLIRKDWCWERLKAGEGDDRGWDGWMVGWHHPWIWVGSGNWWWTGGLACCSPWGHKELDKTERPNWRFHFGICFSILLYF